MTSHPMRRADRARDRDFSLALIDRCTHGVVAVNDTEAGAPYCLPLSLVRIGNRLYFHGAKTGRKLELMARNPRVCVTFVAEDTPAFLPPFEYTTYYQSVIATGTASQVTDPDEQVAALRALCSRMTPEAMDEEIFSRAIGADLKYTAVWRIELEEISGKEKPHPKN